MNENDDVLRDALAGIKTKRIRRRISRFNPEDGLLFDIEEGKTYVPGKGIVQVQDVKEKILDCGHSARIGLGHVAECGHTVCVLCIEKFVFQCAELSCFRKLCTVEGCSLSAHFVDGVYFCKRHSVMATVGSLGCSLFMNRTKNEKRVFAICDEYYSRRLQLRGGSETKHDKGESGT